MTLLLLLPFICCYSIADAHCRSGVRSGTFNVLHYGARANGFSDDSKAFMAAWKAACAASGNVKLHVPRRKYLVGPVKFDGPCRNVRSITVDMQGYLKASTDLSKYVEGDDWIQFGHVDKLTLAGGGTFDGQGAVSWPFNKCPRKKNCRVLPTSIKFLATTDTVVRRVKSLNSKFFHVAVVGCKGFQGSNIRIYAPSDSPNTDGIHIERSSDVTISNSVIATGDDCISIGQGNVRVRISSITCGPGHGISVGSLGRYRDEGDVRGLVVRDSAISGTTNGIRIKTWQNSPGSSSATNMTFRNISMQGVANPIIIDQMYCPFVSCPSQAPSRVKISDIFFRDIRGTSATPVAVTLKCSRGAPCRNVNLHNVHLRYTGGAAATAECWNVKARYSGTQMPAPCH